MKFDQLTKNKLRNFDQTPKLTETFDQLIRSSEIRSSDRFPSYDARFFKENPAQFSNSLITFLKWPFKKTLTGSYNDAERAFWKSPQQNNVEKHDNIVGIHCH